MVISTPSQAKFATPGALVDEFLRIIMIPDPEAARRFTAPNMRIRFTGGRKMSQPADCTAFNASRYKWVKKRIERTETVVTTAVTSAGTPLQVDETVVYSIGTPFEGNRYVDRYVVRAGLITAMDVWNDSAEWLLTRAGQVLN